MREDEWCVLGHIFVKHQKYFLQIFTFTFIFQFSKVDRNNFQILANNRIDCWCKDGTLQYSIA